MAAGSIAPDGDSVGAQPEQATQKAAVREIGVGAPIAHLYGRSFGERNAGGWGGPATGRVIEIGLQAQQTVVFDSTSLAQLGLEALDGGVSCWNEFVDRFFTIESWNSPHAADRSMEISGPTVVCRSGDWTGFRGDRWGAEFVLEYVDQGPQEVIVGQLDQLTSANDTVNYGNVVSESDGAGARLPMREGERTRLIGAAGTWPTGLEASSGGRLRDGAAPYVLSYDVESVADDGSALTAHIPERGFAPGESRDGQLFLHSSAVRQPGVPQWTDTAIWGHLITLAADIAPTSTRLALSNSVTLSFRPIRATAAVTLPAGATPPGGEIAFHVDGKEVQRVDLPAGSPAKVTTTLPAMKRGVHEVVAIYDGSDAYGPSTSPTERVRVVF